MPTALLVLVLAQGAQCTPEATALMKAASERAAVFDLAGALQRMQAAVKSGCTDAMLPVLYLRGWIAARDAYRVGGSPESLRPVLQSIATLQDTMGKSGPPQIAALVLQAAAAAAQSERDEMSLMIAGACSSRTRSRRARPAGLPLITAHEDGGRACGCRCIATTRRGGVHAARGAPATRRASRSAWRAAGGRTRCRAACKEYRALVTSWTGARPRAARAVRGAHIPAPARRVRRPVTPR